MRCPYCGGLNSERASFCAQCGRDLPHAQANTRQQPVQQPYQPSRQQPAQRPPYSPAQHPFPTQGATRPAQQPHQPARMPQQTPAAMPSRQAPVQPPIRPPAPPSIQPQQLQQQAEAPAHFPPHTIAHLRELESEAVPFTILDDAIVDKRKKVIRIVYRRCAPWEQVATLLKVFNEQDTKAVDTVIVQGIVEREATPYEFSNGQLRFDRNVRLGSQTLSRYQIETGNGFENDSLRIVLAE